MENSTKNSNDEEHVMHSKSDNTEIMINDKADEVIDELSPLLLFRYINEIVILSFIVFIYYITNVIK